MSTAIIVTLIIVCAIIFAPILRALAVLLFVGICFIIGVIGAAIYCAFSFPVEFVRGIRENRETAKKQNKYIEK